MPGSSKPFDRSCALVIPGLLDLPSMDCEAAFDYVGSLPALEQYLARAQCKAFGRVGLESVLFDVFDVETAPEHDLPVAPVSYLNDTGQSPDSWCLRADPVHLLPDRDHLVLAGPEALALSQTEADQLATELNVLFEEDGWRIEASTPTRWHLHLPEDPQIRTYDLAMVRGRAISNYLPTGPNGKQWHRVMNEVQMILHASAVNQDRQAANQLPVSSLWFWGGGNTPAVGPESGNSRASQLWSAECVSSGLAQLSRTPRSPLPETATEWLAQATLPGGHLVVLDKLQRDWQCEGVDAWAQSLRLLDEQWIAPMLGALKRREIKQLSLYDCHGSVYQLTPARLRRWWRRKAPLTRYCQHESVS